jgi:acetoin utilization protein AcuB
MLVKDIMTRNPQTISLMASVAEAVTLMNQLNIKHLLVVNGNMLVGIISIKDIPQYIKPQLTVFDIMTPNPICVQANENIQHAQNLLLSYNIASLPVLEGKVLAGIVTTFDFN